MHPYAKIHIARKYRHAALCAAAHGWLRILRTSDARQHNTLMGFREGRGLAWSIQDIFYELSIRVSGCNGIGRFAEDHDGVKLASVAALD